MRSAVRLPHVPPMRDGGASATPSGAGAIATEDLEGYLGNIERDLILKTLQDTKYNRTKAAEKLGITFRALRYRLKKLGIE